MMKKITYIFLIFCFSTTLFAQKKGAVKQGTVKEGDKLFAKKSYIKAAEQYEQVPQSLKVLQNLGDCYYYNFQMNNAVRAYGQLYFTYKDSLKPEVLFRYANALKGTNDLIKGAEIMSKYLGFEQNTPKFMKNITRNTPKSFKLQMMTKNKTNGDFGISFYGDKVAFASTRNFESPVYKWNEKPYLDLYSATVSSKGQLERIEPFPAVINTKSHESSATFSTDGKTMYFNRTGDKQVQVGTEKVATVKIYKAEFIDGKWDKVTMTPFSSDQYSVEHPSLSKDGKTLYFASDMAGTIGSMDIYRVTINDDGTYSQPLNLGENINTNQREQFPFMAGDNTLYFASDGHQGNGNLDIFMSTMLEDGQFDKPMNLGSSINSEMDDFNFIIKEKDSTGYFASNRTGDDNLYSFVQEENKLQYLVEGEVRDKKTSELLPGSVVKLYDMNGNLLEEVVVGKDGTFAFNTQPNTKYKVIAFKDFYIPYEAEFDTGQQGKVYLDLQMKVESYYDAEDIINKKEDGTIQIELENIYFDLDKWNIKPQAAGVLDILVGILKKYPYMEIEIGAHTDSQASDVYNLRLSNRRAASALEYLVQNGINRSRLKSKGYGESRPLILCPNNDCTPQEHATNRRCNFIILK